MDGLNFAKILFKLLAEREKNIIDIISTGGVKDWEGYKDLVGELRGVSFVRNEIKTLLEKHTEDAEDIIGS
jgi:hypothetical protein|tara:strand:+ start:607 stop:819 length:213 start_codon:yes stop_codon:yes gene_type:complete